MKTYQFDADIACKYGVDCAVMIWNLSFWIEHNRANGMHFHDGRYWTYNSVDAFLKLFPFWTRAQVRRILKSLEDAGVIMTGNYNASTYDRTTWYAFTDCFQQMHLSNSANGIVENDKSIDNSINNSDIYTDNKPYMPADGGVHMGKRKSLKKTSERVPCLFADSRYSDIDAFSAEFRGADYTGIDLAYYFHAVADWSSRNGKKQKDWIATARTFMRKDRQAGHLVMAPGVEMAPDAIAYLEMMR